MPNSFCIFLASRPTRDLISGVLGLVGDLKFTIFAGWPFLFSLIEPDVNFSVFDALAAGPNSESIGPDTHPNCATKEVRIRENFRILIPLEF